MYINKKIEEIGKKHGGQIKSEFTLAYWIHQAGYFIYQAKKFKNRADLERLYVEKNNCATMMLETNKNVKVYKPDLNVSKWLIVLENELEGYKYNIVVPYLLVKNMVDIDTLEETTNNKDEISLNGVEFRTTVYVNKGNKLQYCLDNMVKSRNKMKEKINGISK